MHLRAKLLKIFHTDIKYTIKLKVLSLNKHCLWAVKKFYKRYKYLFLRDIFGLVLKQVIK